MYLDLHSCHNAAHPAALEPVLPDELLGPRLSIQNPGPVVEVPPPTDGRESRKAWNILRQQVAILMDEVMAKEDRIRELDCPPSLDNEERQAWACGALAVVRRLVASIHDTLQYLLRETPGSNAKLIQPIKGRVVQVRRELDLVTDILARDIIPRLQ